MAEEQQQSKGIGELFVEFGAKGLPSLLKGLNTVSASFLLGKISANQFVQTLNKSIKEAEQAAVQFGKMSNALGISLQEYMKLHLYLKSHNLSDSLLNDLSSTSDMLTKVQMGIGGISGEFAYAMNRMGLSWQDYDGSMESMIQFANDVKKATEGMDEAQKRVLMKVVGLSNPEWGYAFERGDFDLSEYKTVSDKKVEDLIKAQEATANLDAEMEQLKMHLVSDLTPAVKTIANFLSTKVGKIIEGDKVTNAQFKTAAGGIAAGAVVGGVLGGIAGGIPGARGGAQLGALITTGTAAGAIITGDKINEKINGSPTGGAAPIVPPVMQNGHIPSNLTNTNTNTNITVNNENKITVANPEDVGRAISSINQETLTNINYNSSQILNRAAL